MPPFVVISEQGPAWENNRGMRDQKGWEEHRVFMNALESERFIVLGGPLRNYSKHRALLVCNAASEEELRRRLAEDPWMVTGVLRIIDLYSWEILLGQLP
jgi:uncharacterized protein YciI